jgi:hypothetical protein
MNFKVQGSVSPKDLTGVAGALLGSLPLNKYDAQKRGDGFHILHHRN